MSAQRLILKIMGFMVIVGCILVIVFIGFRIENSRIKARVTTKQNEYRAIQDQVRVGMVSQKLAETLVQELTPLSEQKAEIKDLLIRYGVPLSQKPVEKTP
jgi:hypothetical protein